MYNFSFSGIDLEMLCMELEKTMGMHGWDENDVGVI